MVHEVPRRRRDREGGPPRQRQGRRPADGGRPAAGRRSGAGRAGRPARRPRPPPAGRPPRGFRAGVGGPGPDAEVRPRHPREVPGGAADGVRVSAVGRHRRRAGGAVPRGPAAGGHGEGDQQSPRDRLQDVHALDGSGRSGGGRPPRPVAEDQRRNGRAEGPADADRRPVRPPADRRRGRTGPGRLTGAGPGDAVPHRGDDRAAGGGVGQSHRPVVRPVRGPADGRGRRRVQQAEAAGRSAASRRPRRPAGGVRGRTGRGPERRAGRGPVGRSRGPRGPVAAGHGRQDAAGRPRGRRHPVLRRTGPGFRLPRPAPPVHHRPRRERGSPEGRADPRAAFDHPADDGPVHQDRPGEVGRRPEPPVGRRPVRGGAAVRPRRFRGPAAGAGTLAGDAAGRPAGRCGCTGGCTGPTGRSGFGRVKCPHVHP